MLRELCFAPENIGGRDLIPAGGAGLRRVEFVQCASTVFEIRRQPFESKDGDSEHFVAGRLPRPAQGGQCFAICEHVWPFRDGDCSTRVPRTTRTILFTADCHARRLPSPPLQASLQASSLPHSWPSSAMDGTLPPAPVAPLLPLPPPPPRHLKHLPAAARTRRSGRTARSSAAQLTSCSPSGRGPRVR